MDLQNIMSGKQKMKLTKEMASTRFSKKDMIIVGEYINTQKKVLVRHDTCGYEWECVPNDIFRRAKAGCPNCLYNSLRLNPDEINKTLAARNITMLGEYKNSHSTMEFIHHDCGQRWHTKAYSVTQGHGCPSCVDPTIGGLKPDRPATLYYLRVNNGQAYKIGITSQKVNTRFWGAVSKIHIIKEWPYSRGEHARAHERVMLKCYEKDRYHGPNLLPDGNTELFSRDVLNLDTDYRQ